MTYRRFANWDIELGGIRQVNGIRSLVWTHEEEFGIKFRQRETRFTVRTTDMMSLTEIERLLPELARVRADYHHKMGTGNEANLHPRDIEITGILENFGVSLPYWLK